MTSAQKELLTVLHCRPPGKQVAPQVGNADEWKADGTGDSLAIGDVHLESPYDGAVELSFAGDVDDEGRVDFGVLDHVASDVRQQFGVEEVAGCAGVHGHVEANRLGVGVGREKRESHAGWRDGKSCCGTRRMLSSRVVWVDHGGRGRGGNHLAIVGLLMISVVAVAVVVVASVVVADVVVSSVVVAVVVVAPVVVAVVVVSTVLLSALVAAAPVIVVALSLSVTSLLVATVTAAVVLLLLTTVRNFVSRRFVESAPVAVPAAGSVSRRLLVILINITNTFFVTFLFAKSIEFGSRCRHCRGAALCCARGPTFLFYAIGVHVTHNDHSI